MEFLNFIKSFLSLDTLPLMLLLVFIIAVYYKFMIDPSIQSIRSNTESTRETLDNVISALTRLQEEITTNSAILQAQKDNLDKSREETKDLLNKLSLELLDKLQTLSRMLENLTTTVNLNVEDIKRCKAIIDTISTNVSIIVSANKTQQVVQQPGTTLEDRLLNELLKAKTALAESEKKLEQVNNNFKL